MSNVNTTTTTQHHCRARWIEGNCKAALIPATLLQLRDRAWIIDQALTALPPTADDAAALLAAALQETDRQAAHLSTQHQAAEEPTPPPALLQCWCQRLTLLGHRARLATLAATGAPYNAAVWGSLRDVPLPTAAERLAACGRSDMLCTMLQRHPYALAPSVLDVLHCGALVDASVVRVVWSGYVASDRGGPPLLESGLDWVESDVGVLDALREAGHYAATTATEAMCRRMLGWRPPGPAQVVERGGDG